MGVRKALSRTEQAEIKRGNFASAKFEWLREKRPEGDS